MSIGVAKLQAVDWRFVGRGLAIAGVIACFALSSVAPLSYYFRDHSDHLWIDAHIYFRATEAWLGGADPWRGTYLDIPFAAAPPSLLLNVPLLPFGEGFAVAFWPIANALAIVLLLRRLRLPLWWILFQPILEAWLGCWRSDGGARSWRVSRWS
jgi:hypothetical protein